ncbi:MAG TPA: cobalamin-dependent protein, partial [bacterium]|nr:cobalamin-dependent protein [bacterium]
MSISAYLLSKGIENKIVDPKGLPGDTAFRNIVDNAALENPDVIGITCCATEIFEIKKLCREIKKRVPGTRIVLGGPHPTYRPDDFIRAEVDFDYIIRGEGEISFYKLTEALRKKEDPKSVDGLCIKTEK